MATTPPGTELEQPDDGASVPQGKASEGRSTEPARPARQPRHRGRLQVYARPGLHMTRQVAGDLSLVLWTLLWVVVARWVKHLVDDLAVPARGLADAARDVANSSGRAGEQVQHVPGIGGAIASPFQTLQQQLGSVQQSANHQVVVIHHLAWGVAVLTVAIPVAVVAWRWLPGRLQFVREATAARRMADSDADLDLFALRAMAHLPLSQLARVSEDPVGDWRRGDRAVIDRLAELELRRSNLEVRLARRPQAPRSTTSSH